MKTSPELFVIAGPNGAGKTTFAREFLPKYAKCQEFVNADLIAGGLSPFSPGAAAIEAGRIMLHRIEELSAQRHTFAFETTLSGRSYLSLFKKLRAGGYRIHLIFLWLPQVELAIQRVKERIHRGGHSVPEQDIRRRFDRGIKNLLTEYHVLVDTWGLFDNSGSQPRPIAKAKEGIIERIDAPLFEKIREGLK
ncbi:MAG TPA: Zeta toxin family protein [Elusimicrobia bacterium]|nr:MAG: Zeta toxin family protein [Elusimicrobia bacterium GWA2_66_18]HAZ07379.1 Zeta toxin family protein [Elusimicrobiota bacterium]